MNFIKLVLKNKEADEKAFNAIYESMIIQKIRAKYSINQELAILRQRDEKPDEFAEYNAYVEQCKADIKAELEIK